jgi:hypothetical protein
MTFNFRQRRGVWRGRAWRGSLLGTLCITALVATACGSAQSGGSGGSGQTISLYYVAPLTGSGDVTGIAGCDGEQLAVSDINAAGGSPRDR